MPDQSPDNGPATPFVRLTIEYNQGEFICSFPTRAGPLFEHGEATLWFSLIPAGCVRLL